MYRYQTAAARCVRWQLANWCRRAETTAARRAATAAARPMGLSQRECPSTGAFLNGRCASTAGFRTLQVKLGLFPKFSCCYFGPKRGVKFHNEHVCMTVCLSIHISKTTCSNITKFSVHVTHSHSSDDNVISYVLLVLWVTSSLPRMGYMARGYEGEWSQWLTGGQPRERSHDAYDCFNLLFIIRQVMNKQRINYRLLDYRIQIRIRDESEPKVNPTHTRHA